MAHERAETTAMLTTVRRRDQRVHFGALLAAVRGPNGPDQSLGFSEANVRAAGPFGTLEPDVVVLLFDRILRAGHAVHGNGSQTGDRVEVAKPTHIRNAASDVYALAKTCQYMTACFKCNGKAVRLEAAAVACTSLAPTHLASDKDIETPVLDQFMQEQRSRFDLQMLESALVSMVTHCAADHCRAMRRAHNVRIGNQFPARLEQDVVLRHLLGGQKPLVKVVHTSFKEMWTPVGGLSARDNQPECVIATVENGQIHIACLRDEPPLGICPNTALCRVWKFGPPPPPPWKSLPPPSPQTSISGDDWRVKCVAPSPCGQWIALVRTHRLCNHQEGVFDHDLTVWNIRRLDKPYWTCRREFTSIQTAWFRQAEITAHHAEDDQHRPNATILCFCATRHIPPPPWRNQLHHWYPNANPIGITKVYQYCVEDGSLPKLEYIPDWHGNVLRPTGHCLDTHTVRFPVFDGTHSEETSLGSTSLPAECRDSFGVCLFGLVEAGVDTGFPYRTLAVQQCVVLDLSYKHRNGNSAALLRAVMPMQGVTGHMPPFQKLAQLSPRGDLAVVLVQGTESSMHVPTNVMFNTIGYQLHILGRRGTNVQFAPLARLDLNRSVHRFRTERALATALATSDIGPPRPDGCVRIRLPPSTRAFSPCGRFLLLGFSDGVRFSRSEEGHQAHMDPPLHADGGMCVVDLSEIWEAPADGSPGGGAALAWIECKADVVPLRMRWTTAGLWLTTRRGPLLLGTAKLATDKPRAARS